MNRQNQVTFGRRGTAARNSKFRVDTQIITGSGVRMAVRGKAVKGFTVAAMNANPMHFIQRGFGAYYEGDAEQQKKFREIAKKFTEDSTARKLAAFQGGQLLDATTADKIMTLKEASKALAKENQGQSKQIELAKQASLLAAKEMQSKESELEELRRQLKETTAKVALQKKALEGQKTVVVKTTKKQP